MVTTSSSYEYFFMTSDNLLCDIGTATYEEWASVLGTGWKELAKYKNLPRKYTKKITGK